MKELIIFIGMVVMIVVIIEINERINAKRKKKECPKEKPEAASCSGCQIADICEKEEKAI